MNIPPYREQITQPDGMVHTFDLDDDGERFCFSAKHPTGWKTFVGDSGEFTLDLPGMGLSLDLTPDQFTTLRAFLNGPELETALTAAREWFAADPAKAPINSPERAIFEREKFERVFVRALDNEPDEAKRAQLKALNQQVLDVAESLRRARDA